MTRKEKVIKYLKGAGYPYTCQELTKLIIKDEKLTGNRARYLSGSISSILLKMYVSKEVIRIPSIGANGGYGYSINN